MGLFGPSSKSGSLWFSRDTASAASACTTSYAARPLVRLIPFRSSRHLRSPQTLACLVDNSAFYYLGPGKSDEVVAIQAVRYHIAHADMDQTRISTHVLQYLHLEEGPGSYNLFLVKSYESKQANKWARHGPILILVYSDFLLFLSFFSVLICLLSPIISLSGSSQS